MNKIKAAIVFGGRSKEHEVSLMSGKTIIDALNEEGSFDIVPILISKEGRFFHYETNTPILFDPFDGILLNNYGYTKIPVDVVFPALHGKDGEDGSLQGLFRTLRIPYVGCDVLSSAICLDKPVSKRLTKDIEGLSQVEFLDFYADEYSGNLAALAAKIDEKLGFPCFIKPATTGSSLGMSKVSGKHELYPAVKTASEFDNKIIAEKLVSGRELEVGILGNKNPIASPVGEITTKEGFYDYEKKYIEGMADIIIPARIDIEISEKVRALALEIYKRLGCAGLARVDFFLENGTGNIIFNEVNTMPGFTKTSMYHRLFGHAGRDLPKLAGKLIELALEVPRE